MAASKRRSTRLTPREKQVIALVAEGLTAVEIGRVFDRSRWTANQWRSSANRKLGARNPAHLVLLAHTTGTPEPVLPFEPDALASMLKKLAAKR